MKKVLFFAITSCFVSLYSNPPDIHPTDYKLFEEILRMDPNVIKSYIWFGNAGEVFIYYQGTYMQIDSWHTPVPLGDLEP